MADPIYDVNQLIRFAATFKNDAGVPTDPSTVLLHITLHSTKQQTTYTYLTDLALIRDGVGLYHLDTVPPGIGIVIWRWEGNGAVQAGLNGTIMIRGVEQ